MDYPYTLNTSVSIVINGTGIWDNFTHFILAISFFSLPHLNLNLIPLQPQLHMSPMSKDTKLYSWQELLMQIRGGGIGILWRGSPAPPLYYFQSLGSPLPASCSLLEHLNWVSRMKSNLFFTCCDVWGEHWSPPQPRDSFLENTTANKKVLHLGNNSNMQAKSLWLIKWQLSEHLYMATITLQGSGERPQQLLSKQ